MSQERTLAQSAVSSAAIDELPLRIFDEVDQFHVGKNKTIMPIRNKDFSKAFIVSFNSGNLQQVKVKVKQTHYRSG